MHNLKPHQKRKARILSLQIIYAQEFNGSDIEATCKYMVDPNDIPERDVIEYSKHLSKLTIDNLKKNR